MNQIDTTHQKELEAKIIHGQHHHLSENNFESMSGAEVASQYVHTRKKIASHL